MTMTRPVATQRIVRELGEAEFALNDALLKQAALFTTMVSARLDVNAGHFTGQDALMRLTKSQQSLLTAGNDLARVHGRLRDVDRELGGVGQDCPDDWRAWGVTQEAEVA